MNEIKTLKSNCLCLYNIQLFGFFDMWPLKNTKNIINTKNKKMENLFNFPMYSLN